METEFFSSFNGIAAIFATTVLLIILRPNLFFKKKRQRNQEINPSQHIDLLNKRLANFAPAPLTEPLNEYDRMNLSNVSRYQVISKPERMIKVRSNSSIIELLNFGSVDFLGAAIDKNITGQIAIDALNHYGVGSCGPRSFYGTFDVHLILEKKLADFLGTEACIVYSDGFATIPGVLGAFVERSDILVIDEGVNQSIRNGAQLTRATTAYFKHTDITDLERVLKRISKTKKKKQRIFLVSESIFRTTGKLCHLKGLLNLREKYKARLFFDESLSIGVLGKNGKGLWEHEGVDITKIDFFCGTLDNAFATVGGFCASNQVISTHQRLAGAGYIFSAAVAPVLSVTATAAIERLETAVKTRVSSDDWLAADLRKNIRLFHEKFARNTFLRSKFETISSHQSPLCHIALKSNQSKLIQYKEVRNVCNKLFEHNIYVVATAQTPYEQSLSWLAPTFKIAFSTRQNSNDVERLISSLEEIAKTL